MLSVIPALVAGIHVPKCPFIRVLIIRTMDHRDKPGDDGWELGLFVRLSLYFTRPKSHPGRISHKLRSPCIR